MLCKYPIVKPGVKVVPCGQCMPCRINKKREWAGRLLMESKLHPYSYFVTLTYDEDHCPPELSREDASKFVKSLRKKFPGIRYFLVGEYGDRTGRPHFHVILYTSCIRNTIEAGLRRTCWKKGHVHIGASFNRAVANYASGYVTKKNTKSIEDDGLDGQDEKKLEPEFIRVSQRPALGDGYLPYLIDACRSSDYVNQFGDVPRSVKIGERTYPLARRIRVKLREHFGICDADGVIGNAPGS